VSSAAAAYAQSALSGGSQAGNDFLRNGRKPLHRNHNSDGAQEMSSASAGVKLLRPDERVTKAHTAERVAFALQAWGRERSAPIARVQQIAGVDRKTAAAWYRGKSPPQSEHLLTLARAIPELKGEVRRLLHMESDLDPEFTREMTALLQRYGR
jgi:hypothetical protein